MKKIDYRDKLDKIGRGISGKVRRFPRDRNATIDLVVYLDGCRVEQTDLSRSLFSLSNKLENDFSPILWRVCNV